MRVLMLEPPTDLLEVGVGEVFIIDQDTLEDEVFRSLDASTGRPVRAGDTSIQALDVHLERITDDHLRVHFADGTVHDVRLSPPTPRS